MKRLLLSFGCLFPLVATHASTDESAPAATAPTASEETPAEVRVEPTAETASMLRIGDLKLEQRDWEFARLAYSQVITAGRAATADQVRVALIGLARAYRGELQLPKACAVYERYIKDYPGDEQLPVVYLELGRCLRALGAHQLAIARFYSVLNSTLKLPEDGADIHRQLARTAQFEIAETYFQSGDYEQAFRFYSRLRLLDLAPVDRARAAFKSAYALNLTGDYEQTVAQLRGYLSLYPDHEDVAEARHLLAIALRRLGRSQESLAATLELLQAETSRTDASPETWSHWQRKTGNQLANEFYEQGDIMAALTIYQCLRDLGGPAEWLLPVQYQIGLCQERLRQPDLARATYDGILEALRTKPEGTSTNPPLLQEINAMVTWRLKHLTWHETTGEKSQLFTPAVGTSMSADSPRTPSSIPATP